MNTIKVIFQLEHYFEAYWIRSIWYVCTTHSVDQWLECLTIPYPKEETPKMYWLISILPGINKDYGKPDPNIKLYTQPVNYSKYILENICNLKVALVFSPYHWPYGLKEFALSGTHKGRNYFQGVIHNTYHGGHIETDHYVIFSITWDVSNHDSLPKFTVPGMELWRKFWTMAQWKHITCP